MNRLDLCKSIFYYRNFLWLVIKDTVAFTWLSLKSHALEEARCHIMRTKSGTRSKELRLPAKSQQGPEASINSHRCEPSFKQTFQPCFSL